jgi:hypothetical protein
MNICGMLGSAKLDFVCLNLRGAALQCYRKFKKDKPAGTWNDFKEVLKGTFQSEDQQRRLRRELKELKNKGNYNQYVNNFYQIVNQLNNMPDSELIFYFLEGLGPKTKSNVLAKECKSLVDTIKYASIYEDCFSSNKQPDVKQVNYSRAHYGNKNTKNFNGQKRFTGYKFKFKGNKFNKNYSSNSGAQSKGNDAQREKGITCYNCKKPGHLKKDCKVGNKPPHKVNNVEVTSGRDCEENDRQEYVYSCVSDETRLLTVDGMVGDVRMQLSFDSGATASIISADVVNKHGFKILSSDVKIKTADNTVKKVVGITEPLNIDIRGHSCILELLIIDHEDHDVLLGLNWFRETGAGLFPAERLLKFPGHNIYLVDNVEEVNRHDEVFVTEIVDNLVNRLNE